MSEKRRLTIGVTINLGNYESLRMEVEGEVEGENDAAELSKYLDTVLSGYGKGDEQAGQAIRKYRESVLTHKVIVPIEVYPENDELLSPLVLESVTVPEPKVPEPIPEPETIPIPEPVIKEPEPVLEIEPVPVPEPVIEEPTLKTPEPVTEPEPLGSFTCEKCGAEVSKVQRDVSNLFMGKTLCKTCMK